MMLHIYGRTEAGLVRQDNEDHLLVGDMIRNRGTLTRRLALDNEVITGRGLLLGIADGIGGAAGGATASRLALTHLSRTFSPLSARPLRERLLAAAQAANSALLGVARTQPELAGMGCTLAGVCATPSGFVVFHAGDSRVYRYRNGVLKSLTLDDTEPGLAVRAGRLTVAAASRHPRRHVLTNSVGSPRFALTVEDGPVPRVDDVVMVCSDGLHDLVPPAEMEDLFDGALPDITALGDRLVDCANGHGGHDNVSVLLLRFAAPVVPTARDATLSSEGEVN